MGSFGDPHLVRSALPWASPQLAAVLTKSVTQPEHLTKREKALEDSQWRNLMLPRLDEYARKMLPRKDLPDAAFHKRELVSKSRLARLEDYVAETVSLCEHDAGRGLAPDPAPLAPAGLRPPHRRPRP